LAVPVLSGYETDDGGLPERFVESSGVKRWKHRETNELIFRCESEGEPGDEDYKQTVVLKGWSAFYLRYGIICRGIPPPGRSEDCLDLEKLSAKKNKHKRPVRSLSCSHQYNSVTLDEPEEVLSRSRNFQSRWIRNEIDKKLHKMEAARKKKEQKFCVKDASTDCDDLIEKSNAETSCADLVEKDDAEISCVVLTADAATVCAKVILFDAETICDDLIEKADAATQCKKQKFWHKLFACFIKH
jgi:hypothetical protein